VFQVFSLYLFPDAVQDEGVLAFPAPLGPRGMWHVAGMVIEGSVGWEELSHLDEVQMSQEFVLFA
jgi:hypothetical protein